MFIKILNKELLLQFYSAKFLVMILLVILLSVAGSMFMVQDYQLRQENYETLRPADNETVGLRAPVGMSIFIKGLDELLGRSTRVWKGFGRFDINSTQSSANRLFMLFRQLDFHFIITVVLSLAAMLFTFDSFSGEKQEGTLKFNLANPVSRPTIVLSKWVSLSLSTLIPYLISYLVVLLFIYTLVPQVTGGDFLFRSMMLLLGGAVFLLSFVSLGMLVSVFNTKRATSLVIGLLVWALFVFALPNSLAVMSKNTSGAKTISSLFISAQKVWFEQAFKASNGMVPEDENVNHMLETGNRFTSVYNDYNNGLGIQIDNLRKTAAFPPTQAFSLYAWAVAGTGPSELYHHNSALIRYQQQVMEESADRYRKVQSGEIENSEYQFSPFNASARDAVDVFFSEALMNLVILTAYSLLCLLATVVMFNRYDVR
jgi:ABC-type transport system involved in multi-copper enzyme maturation permease subunit